MHPRDDVILIDLVQKNPWNERKTYGVESKLEKTNDPKGSQKYLIGTKTGGFGHVNAQKSLVFSFISLD